MDATGGRMTGLGTAIGVTRKASCWQVLRNRKIAWLWGAYIISLLGDTLHNIAVMVLIWQQTGNTVLVGMATQVKLWKNLPAHAVP
jgi:hypothetical protein